MSNSNYPKVLITGLGRSGTSAIASVFNSLGYYMPNAESHSNLEDLRLRDLLSKGYIDEIVLELSERTKMYDLVAWKDPKLYGEKGFQLNNKLDKDWLYILVFRDSYSIALRNNISIGQDLYDGLIKAAKSNLKLAEFYGLIKDKNPTYVISYEKFMMDPKSFLVSLLDFLGLESKNEVVEKILNRALEDHNRYLFDADNKRVINETNS